MVRIVRRAVDVHRRRAPGLVVLAGVAGSAQTHQIQRLDAQCRCSTQFLLMVDMAGLAQTDQAGATTLALVAAVMQRLLAGSFPFVPVIEGHVGYDTPTCVAPAYRITAHPTL